MEKELKEALEEKFYCTTRFAEQIEKIVLLNHEMNYIDAIVYLCEQNSIDVELVTKLISKPLKEKIKCDAVHLNYLKKSSLAKLPI